MKKLALIAATAAVCFLTALNVSIAFNSNNGLGGSLKDIEALAWVENQFGEWVREPGDDPDDHNSDDEEYYSQAHDWVSCSQPGFENTVVQYFYCESSMTKSGCSQDHVDFKNAGCN